MASACFLVKFHHDVLVVGNGEMCIRDSLMTILSVYTVLRRTSKLVVLFAQSPAYTVRGVVEQMKGFDGRLTVQTMFLRGEWSLLSTMAAIICMTLT